MPVSLYLQDLNYRDGWSAEVNAFHVELTCPWPRCQESWRRDGGSCRPRCCPTPSVLPLRRQWVRSNSTCALCWPYEKIMCLLLYYQVPDLLQNASVGHSTWKYAGREILVNSSSLAMWTQYKFTTSVCGPFWTLLCFSGLSILATNHTLLTDVVYNRALYLIM